MNERKKMINIHQILADHVIAEEKKRSDEHVTSGKLSASALGLPAQWQVLKYLDVPRKENDDYELLKFKRGRDVEDFIVETVKLSLKCKTQIECNYRDCIGFLDLLIDDEAIEIKSVGAMAYRHILKEAQAKKSHALQAGFYGVALGLPLFTICYVNTDTYQSISFQYQTKDFEKEINGIIDRFTSYISNREIPEFNPLEKWQAMPGYQQYPQYQDMSKLELNKEAEKLYTSKGK